MRMNRRRFLQSLGLGVAAAGLSRRGWGQAPRPAGRRPNIVFILADDLGYGDLQCLNPASRIRTPRINALAASGMTFTDAHSGSAVCTPTRYGVLTGRYAWRTRLKRGVLGGYSTHLIDPKRMTVAAMLKSAGYVTGGVGKWHLGMDYARREGPGKEIDYSRPVAFAPTHYGFDEFFGIPASLDMPPYVYVANDRVVERPTASQPGGGFPAFIRKGPRGPGFRPIETLDVLLGKATDFIARRAKDAKPFFLYFAMTAPHKPVLPARRFDGTSRRGPYGDFILQVDWTVGQVVAAVAAAGVRDNTLIVLTSDNGSFMFRLADAAADDHVTKPAIQGYRAGSHRANHIFRGTKTDIYEGGHHVPYLVAWPGRVKRASTCDATICLTDFFATCAEIVGVELPDNAAEDSVSTLDRMLGRAPKAPRPAVVHHSANGTFAVREGKWKLILSTGSGGRERPVGRPGSEPYRLYDLAADPRETTDVAGENFRVVAHLSAVLETFRKTGRSR